MPLITIFVQVYNTRKYIGDCLNSVCNLKGDYDLEILVIDDASPDNSAEIIRQIDDPRIRFIHHDKNTGCNATANEGYRLAKGEFVARLDSDDRYRPELLVESLPILQSNPDVGFTFADIALIDTENTILRPEKNVKRPPGPSIRNELFPLLVDNYVPAPTTIMRKSALEPLLPIPKEYHFLDWYLTTGVSERWKSAYIDRVLADYRLHPSNMHKAMVLDRTGESITLSVLERIFNNEERRDEKQTQRAQIYSANFLTLADKYFGYNMAADARRCYWAAIRHRPNTAFSPGVMRRLMATYIPRKLYENTKRLVRRAPRSA